MSSRSSHVQAVQMRPSAVRAAVAEISGLGQWQDAHAAQSHADGVLCATISRAADRLLALDGLAREVRKLLRALVEAHYRVVERVIG